MNLDTAQNITGIHQTPIRAPKGPTEQTTLIYYDRPIVWLASRAPGQDSHPQYEFVSQVDELSPEEFQCRHRLEIYLVCSVSDELANKIKDPETRVSFRDIYEAPGAQFWLEYECYVPYTAEGAVEPHRLRLGQLENIPQDYLPANLDLSIGLN